MICLRISRPLRGRLVSLSMETKGTKDVGYVVSARLPAHQLTHFVIHADRVELTEVLQSAGVGYINWYSGNIPFCVLGICISLVHSRLDYRN